MNYIIIIIILFSTILSYKFAKQWCYKNLLFKPIDIIFEIDDKSFNEFNINTKNNETIYGCIYYHRYKTDKFILYSHGNSGNIYLNYNSILSLNKLFNANIICYDYQGYGKSSGISTPESVIDNIDSIYEYSKKTFNIDDKNLILYGESLGCSPTLWLGSKLNNVKAVITNSGFSSLRDIVKDVYPLLYLLTPNKLNNKKIIKEIHNDIPVLIFHSKSDSLIPFKHAKCLYDERINEHKMCHLFEVMGEHGYTQFSKQQIKLLNGLFHK